MATNIQATFGKKNASKDAAMRVSRVVERNGLEFSGTRRISYYSSSMSTI